MSESSPVRTLGRRDGLGEVLCLFRGQAGVVWSRCSMPRTPLRGVRISWLILARNSDLAWLAAVAGVGRFPQRLHGLFAFGDVNMRAQHAQGAFPAASFSITCPRAMIHFQAPSQVRIAKFRLERLTSFQTSP